MARPYRDAVELATEPARTGKATLLPKGAVVLRGSYSPGVEGPTPVVLAPAYEYRVRLYRNSSGDEAWIMERRKAPAAKVSSSD